MNEKERYNSLENHSLQFKNKYEKIKNEMGTLRKEHYSKINGQDIIISSLKNEINKNKLTIRNMKLNMYDHKINMRHIDDEIQSQSYLQIKESRSQLKMDQKVSETMFYNNEDDCSSLVPHEKGKHTRRSSSVSNLNNGDISRTNINMDYDHSPSNYGNILDQSRVTKSFIDNNEYDDVSNDEYCPEKDVSYFKSKHNHLQDLSTSYLEDDNEIDNAPVSNKDHSNKSKYDEVHRGVSPIQAENVSITQNLISRRDFGGKITRNANFTKSKSGKRILPKRREDLSHVQSPSDVNKNRFNDDLEMKNYDKTNDPNDSFKNTTNYTEKLEKTHNNFEALSKQFAIVSKGNYQHNSSKEMYQTSANNRSIADIIDSETHNNTCDDNNYEDGAPSSHYTKYDSNKGYSTHNYRNEMDSNNKSREFYPDHQVQNLKRVDSTNCRRNSKPSRHRDELKMRQNQSDLSLSKQK